MCLVRSVGQRFLNLISQWSNNQTALVRDETVCFNGYLWWNQYEISFTLHSSLLRRRERTNVPWTTVIIPGYPCCTPGKGFHLPAVRRGIWAVTLPSCSFTSSLWTPNHILSLFPCCPQFVFQDLHPRSLLVEIYIVLKHLPSILALHQITSTQIAFQWSTSGLITEQWLSSLIKCI